MKVKDIMTRQVEMAQSDVMVEEAAKKMKLHDIGVLPVQEKNQIIGVITDRDIVIRTIADGLNPKITTVRKVMTSQVVCCSENEDVEEAAKLMENKQIHRLVVLNSENKPVGILSVSDIAVKSNDSHLTWEVMEKICEPAMQHQR